MTLRNFKLERYLAKYEFNVPHLLCSSDCESMAIGELLALEEGAAEKFRNQRLGYTESNGAPTLRDEICGLYSTVKPDHIVVHSGAEEAIFLFMHAFLKPGDHVIVHWPCYQSLMEVAREIGCRVTLWQAREKDGWELDLDELEKQIGPDTSLVVLNVPHNPTGYLLPTAKYRTLVEILRSNSVFLFSDEVYRELEHNQADRLPPACDMYENALSLGVMSKAYGLAGLRIGWVAAQRVDILRQMTALKDYTTICNSAPSEFLAEVALRHREKILERNLAIIRENLTLLDSFFGEFADKINWIRPKAGSTAFPCITFGDIVSFCDALARERGLLLLPGSVYDYPGNFFRIGFGRKNMPESLAILRDFLRE